VPALALAMERIFSSVEQPAKWRDMDRTQALEQVYLGHALGEIYLGRAAPWVDFWKTLLARWTLGRHPCGWICPVRKSPSSWRKIYPYPTEALKEQNSPGFLRRRT